MKMSRWIMSTVVVGVLTVSPIGAPPAGAVAVCTANINFTYAPGITVLPTPQAVTGTLVLNCPVLGPDAGMWTLPFAGVGNPEACELGLDAVVFLPGAVGPVGAVVGGFNFAHAYAGLAQLNGIVNGRMLHGTGEWLPILLPGNCVAPPVTSGFFTGVAAIVP